MWLAAMPSLDPVYLSQWAVAAYGMLLVVMCTNQKLCKGYLYPVSCLGSICARAVNPFIVPQALSIVLLLQVVPAKCMFLIGSGRAKKPRTLVSDLEAIYSSCVRFSLGSLLRWYHRVAFMPFPLSPPPISRLHFVLLFADAVVSAFIASGYRKKGQYFTAGTSLATPVCAAVYMMLRWPEYFKDASGAEPFYLVAFGLAVSDAAPLLDLLARLGRRGAAARRDADATSLAEFLADSKASGLELERLARDPSFVFVRYQQ